MHLESESEKRAKNVASHTAKKISRYNPHFFAILDEFFETDLQPIYRSLTCGRKKRSKIDNCSKEAVRLPPLYWHGTEPNDEYNGVVRLKCSTTVRRRLRHRNSMFIQLINVCVRVYEFV